MALAVVMGALSTSHSRQAVPIAIAAVLAAAWLFIAALDLAVGVVVLLITTTLIDRFTLPVGGAAIRAEQIAVVVALGIVVVSHRKASPSTWLRPTFPEALLVLWFVIAFISSVVFAPERFASLKILALLAISASVIFVPRRLLRPDMIETLMRWFLILLLLEAAYGLAAWLLHALGPNLSISVNRDHLSAYGTLWEPNVFGAVCAAGAVAWALVGHRFYRWSWVAIAICAGGATVSFTRSAWIALGLVAVLVLITPARRQVEVGTTALAATTAVALIGALLIVDHVGDYWIAPAAQASASTTPSSRSADVTTNAGDLTDLAGRVYQIRPVLSDLRSHPLLGGGVDSMVQRHNNPSLAHIGNVELSVLNDTGVVGLLIFTAFVLASLFAAWQRRWDPLVVALVGTTLVIAITNQATETMELMFTWLFLGLLLAASDLPSLVRSPRLARLGRVSSA